MGGFQPHGSKYPSVSLVWTTTIVIGEGVGVGNGVGVGAGVAVAVAVAVGIGVDVGLAVAVGEGVGVGAQPANRTPARSPRTISSLLSHLILIATSSRRRGFVTMLGLCYTTPRSKACPCSSEDRAAVS